MYFYLCRFAAPSINKDYKENDLYQITEMNNYNYSLNNFIQRVYSYFDDY